MLRPLALAFASLLLTLPAVAQQPRYVDAVSGSDANDGTSPNSAWKTLTRAAASSAVRIVVAPGLYDAANGEQFPVEFVRTVELLGTSGAVIDAGGAAVAVEFGFVQSTFPGRVEDLEIRGAGIGVLFSGVNQLRVRDCEVHSCSVGISHRSASVMRLDFCEVHSCDIGLHSAVSAPNSWVNFWDGHVRDCRVGLFVEGTGRLGVKRSTITDMQEYGIDQSNGASAAQGRLEVDQVRIERCGRDGIRIRDFDGARVAWLLNCLITDTDTAVRATGSTPSAQLDLLLLYCTLANNRVGIEPESSTSSKLTLNRSILAANTHDFLPLPPRIVTEYVLIQGGAFASRPDVVQADPLFVDPLGGDYRLSWGSPAIDAIPPTDCRYGRHTVDTVFRSVQADGDLDLLNEQDLGAHEFLTLSTPLSQSTANDVEIEVRGLPGSIAVLAVADSRAADGFSTWINGQYGCLGLGREGLRRIAVVPIPANGDPARVTVPVASLGVTVGESRHFQALLQSPSAPFGWAMSARAEVQFVH